MKRLGGGLVPRLMIMLLVVVAIYVVLPQLSDFKASGRLLHQLDWHWAVLALVFSCLTYLAAAGSYYWLAFKKLPYRQLALIEVAAMFVNRLLPGGIGALGTNYAYLRQRHHSSAQAGLMVTANNCLGVLGHLILTAAILASSAGGFKWPLVWQPAWRPVAIGVIVFAIGLTAAIIYFQPRRLSRGLNSLKRPLGVYLKRPQRLLAALGTSLCLTACNFLCLAACAQALGIHLSAAAVVIIFSLGAGAATVTPTPGGLGGFEAGLFAGSVGYKLSPATALSLALLFRLVSYWLPLMAGAVAFFWAERRHWFTSARG